MEANSTEGGGPHQGQLPPVTTITPTDQSGVVLITAALALIFAVISLLIRLFIRYQFRFDFAKDDVLSFSSMVFFLIQSSLVFAQVANGFGKTLLDLSTYDLVEWQKNAYASELFYVITMLFTKCASACLFLRLSPDIAHIRSSQALVALATLFAIVSIFSLALRCDLQHPWIFVGERCEGLYARWQAVTAFDVITELGLFAIALHMVQGILLPWGKKAVVVFAFALRLGVIAPAIFRLNYINMALTSTDPSLNGVLAVACTQIEICYAIIATTAPCLRPFMSALNTHYGGPGTLRTPKGSKASKSGNDYDLSAVAGQTAVQKRLKRGSIASALGPVEKSGGSTPELRWDNTRYNVAVQIGERPRTGDDIETLPDQDHSSTQSHESRRMIICKNTEWTVDFEEQAKRG